MEMDYISILNRAIQHARKAPFYQKRLPNAITSIQDFHSIPFTTKEDLQVQSPYGLIAVNGDELSQYHESSGTTGNPVSAWFSNEDLESVTEKIGDCGVKLSEKDRVLIRYPYALSTISHLTHQAAQRNNACVIPADSRTSITPMPRVIDLMKKLDVTVLACISLQAVMLAEIAEMLGLNPKRDFPTLRAICTAGEPLTPSRRNLLEEIWGVPVYDNYGMTEIGTMMVDCHSQQMHPFGEDLYYELLREDFITPVQPGEVGNLVVTTLKERAMPLIRYKTGDRARFLNMKCHCGKETLMEIWGRKKDVVIMNSIEFDLRELEEMVSFLPCRRFWAVGVYQNTLTFIVEREKESDDVPINLEKRLKKQYGVKIQIQLVDKGTLYDREEMQAFGMSGKPEYFLTEEQIQSILLKTFLKSKGVSS